MHRSLLVRQVLPGVGLFGGLICAGIVFDYALHRAGLGAVGWYLGPIGTFLVVLSFLYSLRKRRLIRSGSPKKLLELHEALGWVGTLCIILHSGIHFNAILPWLALLAMLVVVASGITGAVLLRRAMDTLAAQQGQPQPEDNRVLDAATVEIMRRWRVIHLPINAVFVALALVHIVTIALFRDW